MPGRRRGVPRDGGSAAAGSAMDAELGTGMVLPADPGAAADVPPLSEDQFALYIPDGRRTPEAKTKRVINHQNKIKSSWKESSQHILKKSIWPTCSGLSRDFSDQSSAGLTGILPHSKPISFFLSVSSS